MIKLPLFVQREDYNLFSIKNESKKIKLIVFITCLVFLLINIFSIIRYGNSTLLGSLTNPDNDDVKFIRSAWNLVKDGNYSYHNVGRATVFMMPGLTFTLAFFVKIFGNFGGITAMRFFQAIIQTGSIYLVFLIGRKIFNSKVGAAAIIINVLCIADYWVSNLILTESMFKFFVLLLVYFSIYAIEEMSTKYYILGGIAWGIGTLYRPTIATFPIIILIMWLFRKYKFRDMVKYTAIVGLTFCLILSPWWIRNYSIFHKFIPLTLATGNPMLQGTYINYDQSTKATDGLDYSQFKYPAGNEMDNNTAEMAISRYRLKNLVPKQPFKFLAWYTVGKAYYQLRWPFIWTEFLGVKYWMIALVHYFILIFALLGIIMYFRDKNRYKMGTVVFATLVYFIAAYLPFYAFERYFYPGVPFAILFAASAVIKINDRYEITKKLKNITKIAAN